MLLQEFHALSSKLECSKDAKHQCDQCNDAHQKAILITAVSPKQYQQDESNVDCTQEASSFFTISEIALPSALPASCFVAVPITLPMSCGPFAPTASITFLISVCRSASLSCCGRYLLMISSCTSSRLARSSRPSFAKISADSLRCLAAFVSSFISVSVAMSPLPPFSVSASKIIDLMLRSASNSSLFLASIACLIAL